MIETRITAGSFQELWIGRHGTSVLSLRSNHESGGCWKNGLVAASSAREPASLVFSILAIRAILAISG
jgi:hypothetical protein